MSDSAHGQSGGNRRPASPKYEQLLEAVIQQTEISHSNSEIDSLPPHLANYARAAKQLGSDTTPEQVVEQFVQVSAPTWIGQFVISPDLRDEILSEIKQLLLKNAQASARILNLWRRLAEAR